MGINGVESAEAAAFGKIIGNENKQAIGAMIDSMKIGETMPSSTGVLDMFTPHDKKVESTIQPVDDRTSFVHSETDASCKNLENYHAYVAGDETKRNDQVDSLISGYTHIPQAHKGHDNRPSKIDYYLQLAKDAALRSTCMRRKYGAIIVKDDVIISTGYNGAPRGRVNCIDLGYCYRQEKQIPAGQMYEKCRSVHAEQNAMYQASYDRMFGSVLYLAGVEYGTGKTVDAEPCSMCKRAIINNGIRFVICLHANGTWTSIDVNSWVQNDDSLNPNMGGY